MIKISFVGDIMFERQYLESSNLDFSDLFKQVNKLLDASDYVVANLETVCAGENARYTHGIYSFNTPDEALDAIKKYSKIDLVCTANNHCLDRGLDGLLRTMKKLEEKGISYTGTYIDKTEINRSHIINIKGIKLAFMSYTYGTNTIENKVVLANDDTGHINLLSKQAINRLNIEGVSHSIFRQKLNQVVQYFFSSEKRMMIKKLLRLKLNVPIIDNNIPLDYVFLEKLKLDIKRTKKNVDYIFMCLHSGGQFNAEPGTFTQNIIDFLLNEGVDFIVGTHPHVVQKFLEKDKHKVFYSIGNFSLSPSSIYVLHDLKPEYGIIPHFYFNEDNLELHSITFSIIKIVESRDHNLIVLPVYDLYKQISLEDKVVLKDDILFIYNRVLGNNESVIDVRNEYKII